MIDPAPATPTRAECRLLDAIRRAIAELQSGQPQRALVILSGAEATHG